MFDENDLLPISALQHLVFCERQCALIHLEMQWADNALTIQGKQMHERVHESGDRTESRGDIRIARGLAVRSLRLGLSGIADVVEFCRVSDEGIRLSDISGFWKPIPVEYKRGKPKRDRCDEVQVCAQAMCLEEMLGVDISEGYLFYGANRRRCNVIFDRTLRSETVDAATRLHALIRDQVTPPAVYEPKCERCSLLEICMPAISQKGRTAKSYLDCAIRNALADNQKGHGGA
ncbi:MAG: CRISPR-associated protein Cas4 [Acidobacteriota bacterium]|jgi:CRISPR-associated exonuclease Cas4|nr:CRISPR-associated protein Cas4 [Acidobacteriota bacterium]